MKGEYFMFNFDDHDYIEAINNAYWAEEEEMNYDKKY